ncbi:MAG TPA: cytochrome c [Candidatus Sulfotelmatobacter sp.]|nr:cytochrome c [Candidatus Sulfotelmatobacter sp.]
MRRTRICGILMFTWWLMVVPWMRAQSAELYKEHCANCHGADGSGSTTAGKKMGLSDLRASQIQKLSDEELFKTIAYGINHKQYPHAFLKRGLSEEQINQLVAYVRKLPKSK